MSAAAMSEDAGLRSRLRAGETVVGSWLMTPSTAYVEMASAAGMDFLLVDLEHGEMDLSTLPTLLRALRPGPTRVVVRVPNHDPTMICRVLDRGAHGVLVPRVEDAETAARVASAARFPPHGTRGMAIGAARASAYGFDAGYRARSDEEVVVAVQIESKPAVDGAKAIAGAPGVDVAFIGPNDLSGDLGIEGDPAAIERVVDGLLADLSGGDYALGSIPHGRRSWQDCAGLGIQFLVAGADVGALNQGVRTLVDAVAAFGAGAGSVAGDGRSDRARGES